MFPFLRILTFFAVFVAILYPKNQLFALGTFLTKESPRIILNKIKIAIFFDGKRQTLIANLLFTPVLETNSNFLWFIIVPAKPEVEFLFSDSPFEEIEKLTKPESPEQNQKKLVGFTSFQIFEPENQTLFGNWLTQSGYQLKEAAKPVIDNYQKKNWYLIVFDIDRSKITSQTQETLPVKIAFKTDRIIFPPNLDPAEENWQKNEIEVFLFTKKPYNLEGFKIIEKKRIWRKNIPLQDSWSNFSLMDVIWQDNVRFSHFLATFDSLPKGVIEIRQKANFEKSLLAIIIISWVGFFLLKAKRIKKLFQKK